MPYTVDRYRSNAFNGQPGWPLIINDNNINSNNTSLKIIGRGIPNYGEFIAENFVHILESFAGTAPPDSPITGQIWYETDPLFPGTGLLRVFNGVEFTPVTGASSGSTFPITAIVGQIHSLDGRLFIFDGSNWVALFPYSQGVIDPAIARLGELFFNTTENKVKIRIANPNAEWRTLISDSGEAVSQNFGVANGFYLYKSINAAVTATGTTQISATVLNNNINVIINVSQVNQAVRLADNIPIGTEITIINDTGNINNPNDIPPLLIFPSTSASIDLLPANTSFPIGNFARIVLVKATANKFYSITSIYA